MTQVDASWEAHLACYAEADALYRMGQLPRALKAFRNALALAPGDVDTLWALGDCYSELGKPRRAELFYRKARARAAWKRRGDLLYNIANALLDQRRPASAVRLYRLVPRSAGAYANARRNEARARALMAGMEIDADVISGLLRRPAARGSLVCKG